MHIDTVIFDLEGIVLNTEPLWDREFHRFLERRGIDCRRDELKRALAGRSLEEGAPVLVELLGLKDDLHDIARERRSTMKAILADGVAFIEGFRAYFERIRHQYKLCVATSMDGELLRCAAARCDVFQLFKGNVLSSAEVGCPAKPDPSIFLRAAKALGSDPASCLVFEDSPNGIRSAKNAGMACVALATTFEQSVLQEADLVFGGYEGLEEPRVLAARIESAKASR